MLDNEFFISRESKASLVSIICPSFEEHATEKETTRSLIELRELMRTLNIETGNEYVQNKKNIDPATILGSGKILEIAEAARLEGSTMLVFDCELTSSQIRNLKKITSMSVIDRCHVILEIFSSHAQTNDAKIQIEIARLQYILPRLSGFWSHLGRQKGGIGVRGGEGEQQIELDRRIIRERIEFYKRELKEIEKSRVEQRKRRNKKAITAALVGYTNAGKSSLMNRLCRVNVLEEDKLFATLDSTFRMLNPDTKPPMIMIDTVGFLSNLPNTLIDGFKTTLESALEADLLVIVCDISDEHYEKHLQVTMKVLKELDLENKEKLIVFNKADLVDDQMRKSIIRRTYKDSFIISSYNPEDINNLRSHIVNYFLEKQKNYDLFIPYDAGAAHSLVVSKTNVIKTGNFEKGIYYKVCAPDFIFGPLALNHFIIGPDDPLIDEANLL